ncbi:peptide deformylase [Rhodobacterales bacterium HTCC2150]|nr:peptide deformylase [Rhodobacterales bacterium HTCC2150] [Rhodobacteraceae bacterium HTCC2150]
MIRPTIPWPDQCLRSKANTVGDISDEIRAIWDDMIDTMEAMPGVGLAAPQIGVSLRLCVVDASDERGQTIRMADPDFVGAQGDELRDHEEASPNLPGVSAKITRPAKVTVEYTDDKGERVRKTLEGLWATSVQHQLDHLNGRMYFDNLSKTNRDMLLRRAKKARL